MVETNQSLHSVSQGNTARFHSKVDFLRIFLSECDERPDVIWVLDKDDCKVLNFQNSVILELQNLRCFPKENICFCCIEDISITELIRSSSQEKSFISLKNKTFLAQRRQVEGRSYPKLRLMYQRNSQIRDVWILLSS